MKTNEDIKYVPMYKSYIDAVAKLTPEDRLVIYEAIFEYGFTGIEPIFDNPYLEMGWNLVKPNLVNNIANLEKNIKNGKKGGRPPKKEVPNSVSNEEPQPVEVVTPVLKEELPIPVMIKQEVECDDLDNAFLKEELPTKEELIYLLSTRCDGLNKDDIHTTSEYINNGTITTTKRLDYIINKMIEFNKERV